MHENGILFLFKSFLLLVRSLSGQTMVFPRGNGATEDRSFSHLRVGLGQQLRYLDLRCAQRARREPHVLRILATRAALQQPRAAHEHHRLLLQELGLELRAGQALAPLDGAGQRCVALLPAIGERFDMLLTATRCESTRTALEDVMATIEPRRSAPSVTVARDPESASDNAQPRPMRMRSARKRRSASLGTQSQG